VGNEKWEVGNEKWETPYSLFLITGGESIMKCLQYVIIFFLLIAVSGCGPGNPYFCNQSCLTGFPGSKSFVPFTDEYRKMFEGQLHNVQFYISAPLLLTREIEFEKKMIENNMQHIQRDHKIKEILISERTPGMLRNLGSDTLHVQFEVSSDAQERTIPFARKARQGYARTDPSRYLYQFGQKKIVYDGEKYDVSYDDKDVLVHKKDISVYTDEPDMERGEHYIKAPCYPILMIDLVEHDRIIRELRRARGVRVGSGK